MPGRIKLRGGRELQRNLRQFSERYQRRALRESLKQAAEPIFQEAQARALRAPEPTRPALGHLADNLAVTIRVSKTGKATAKIGPSKDHFWGIFLEFGAVRMGPFPFLRPAFDLNGKRALEEIQNVLARELRRAGR